MLVLRSIRLRLTLWYVLLLALILAAFSAAVYLTLRHGLSSNLDDSLETRSDLLAGLIRYEEDRPTLEGLVSSAGEIDEEFVRLYDSRGDMTFDSTDGAASPTDTVAVEAALQGRSETHTEDVGDDPMRVRTVPVRRDGEVLGVLEVGLSEDDMSETLRTLLLILGIAYPATLVAASAGGVFLAGRALSPIDRITRLAQRISGEDLGQRMETDLPPDEVGRLARTFNDMIARLDAAFRRQRQFTADASHELRTPLTAVKGQIEVALSRDRDARAYRDVLQSVNAEVDRLIRLVGSLLTLARADAGEIPLASEPVNIPDLVNAAVEQVRPAALEKQVDVDVNGGSPATVRVDQDLLLQLLLNLLDNALKYTGSGGKVTVGWDLDGGALRIRVTDTGPGIPAEHLERIFDRFYRVDRARSRAGGGAGLGLSISRWIAEAHGGSLTAESVTGEGSVFEVRLPRLH